MAKPKLIASNIANLTDARYFAARGADYLLLKSDQIGIAEMLEIKEWVEGPEILVQLSAGTVDQVDEIVLKLAPVAVLLADGFDLAPLSHLSGHIPFITRRPDDSFYMSECLFENYRSDKALEDFQGVLLSGGHEKAVGIKSFDDLDELLDQWDELE